MEDKTQKERLEQELRFLKESFEAEVISKEEFDKGKDRIEKKLKEIEPTKTESPETESLSDNVVTESKTEEKIKLKVIQDEEHQHFESEPIKLENTEKKEEKEEPALEKKEDKNESKFFKYAAIFVVLVLIIFFSYSFLKGNKNVEEKTPAQLKFVAACGSDEDCKQEAKEGFCLNPGTEDAKCEFKELLKTNVIVLNDRKNCFNCDTERVLSILESWFGAINPKEIDYGTDGGENLAEKFDAKMLPMYILEDDVTKNLKFEQFKQIFVKKESNYILNEDVAASTFYINRYNIPNKLDLFVVSGDNASIKAEKNLKEFLEAFKEVKFDKHLSNDKLAQELGLKTFPTFLVNNQVKFGGVLSAETIKDNFCKLNRLEGCEKSLTKSLI